MERVSPSTSDGWEFSTPAGLHVKVHGGLSVEALRLLLGGSLEQR